VWRFESARSKEVVDKVCYFTLLLKGLMSPGDSLLLQRDPLLGWRTALCQDIEMEE
jgi:hypothetical protein